MGRFPTKAHFASYAGTAPVEASSGEVVRHRLSLAGNRHLNRAPCTWSPPARPGRTPGAEPTTARRSRRASLVRRRCGASRGASQMPSSRASWQIRGRLRAAPLDKEEPRILIPRTRVNKSEVGALGRPGPRLATHHGMQRRPVLPGIAARGGGQRRGDAAKSTMAGREPSRSGAGSAPALEHLSDRSRKKKRMRERSSLATLAMAKDQRLADSARSRKLSSLEKNGAKLRTVPFGRTVGRQRRSLSQSRLGLEYATKRTRDSARETTQWIPPCWSQDGWVAQNRPWLVQAPWHVSKEARCWIKNTTTSSRRGRSKG